MKLVRIFSVLDACGMELKGIKIVGSQTGSSCITYRNILPRHRFVNNMADSLALRVQIEFKH